METKAQRIERLKREKNPWEALDELRRVAAEGIEKIPAEWMGTYLRWWGVYPQGDGAGVLGGKGGEGKSAPYLMLRIRLTNGLLQAHQLRTIAEVAREHARGIADITVRQNIQLHWIALESLPRVLESLWCAGLTTMGSCGDDTRNITGCPLAGLDGDEIVDASPLALDATRMLVGNRDFYNLPRKFKVSISGCRAWCSYPEINDVAVNAVQINGDIGYSIRVGGGLSADPHLAVKLPFLLRHHEVLPVVKAAAEIYRDAEVLREHRDRARLKHLFLRHGWTADRFASEIEQRLGYAPERHEFDSSPDTYRDHVGIHPQKQPGLSYAGVSIVSGRTSAQQLAAVASIAERFGSGEVRTTNMQNLLIPNVRNERTAEAAQALAEIGLPTSGSPFARGAIACTGAQFCRLAITETKSFTRWLVTELEERMPGFAQHLKLNVTGCPNSCGQHWIADIGIEGKKIKVGTQLVDAYYFCVGGGVGKHQAIARPIGYRCLAADVPDAIERLLDRYLLLRDEDEDLRRFFARHSDEELRYWLAGVPVETALRDASPGRPPHEIDI